MGLGLQAAALRATYTDISGQLTFTAATDDTTLKTVRNSKWTIFIQRIRVYITTNAAQSLSFEDSSGVKIAEVTSSPGDETEWIFEFGDRGIGLTEGANFVAAVSAVGLAGNIVWEGYQRQTATESVS